MLLSLYPAIICASYPTIFFFKQTCKETKDVSALTKAADFVKAFILGFQVEVSNFMISKMGAQKILHVNVLIDLGIFFFFNLSVLVLQFMS